VALDCARRGRPLRRIRTGSCSWTTLRVIGGIAELTASVSRIVV